MPFHYAALGVFTVGTIYSFSELLKAFDEASADNPSLRELDDASDRSMRALGVMLGAVVGAFVLQIPASSHTYESIRMFNRGIAAPDSANAIPLTALLPHTLHVDRGGAVHVGWTIRTR